MTNNQVIDENLGQYNQPQDSHNNLYQLQFSDQNNFHQQYENQQFVQNDTQSQQFDQQQNPPVNQYLQNWDAQQNEDSYDIEAKTYTGQYNGMGQRHGQGTCTNVDGSTYSGNWEYNLKSGYGEITYQDKSRFEGTFVKGKRNGIGKMFLKNRDVIDAMWTNDMLNGEGKIIKPNGIEVKCLFYNNAKIELTANQGEDCYDRCYCSLFCSSIFVTLLSLLLSTQHLAFIGVTIQFWFLMLAELFCCSKTWSYLSNNIKQSQISKQLAKMKLCPPGVEFHIECYHYVTVKTKNGSRRRRRVTHRASKPFQYTQWIDQSADIYSMDYVIKLPMARFETIKNFDYTPQAQRSYDFQKSVFFMANKRDKYQDLTVRNTVDGYVQYQLVINDMEGIVRKSILLNRWVYLFLSFIGLSWFVRIYFVKSVKKVEYNCNKLIIA